MSVSQSSRASQEQASCDNQPIRFGKPMKVPRLVNLPKTVIPFDNFTTHVKMTDELWNDFRNLIYCIEKRGSVPSRYYRKDIDKTPDYLLERDGIMHLHLGSKNSDVLIYLMQFADFIVFIEVNDHKHYDHKPIGGFFRTVLLNLDTRIRRGMEKLGVLDQFKRAGV